jgi:nucleoside-diphosphate-sugar epimerase
VVFDVLVVTTEDNTNYIPHYNAIITLFTTLSQAYVSKTSSKPLVIFTFGCKNHGQSTSLTPHTETSPLNPPPILAPRAKATEEIVSSTHYPFDIVAVRPTNVYGYTSSYYGFFALAEKAVGSGSGKWVIDESPDTILHAMHIDDCADAYVALAGCKREVVKGQIYNISASKYETLRDIAEALAS